MPTAKAKQENEELREEFQALRKEVAAMMSLLEKKGNSYAEVVGEKVGDKLDSYQKTIQDNAEAAYEMGGEGLDEIGKRITKNPVASICIAFGLGYIISKVMEQKQ